MIRIQENQVRTPMMPKRRKTLDTCGLKPWFTDVAYRVVTTTMRRKKIFSITTNWYTVEVTREKHKNSIANTVIDHFQMNLFFWITANIAEFSIAVKSRVVI